MKAIDTGNSPALQRLAHLIEAYAPHDGRFELAIPGVFVARFSQPNTELVHVVQEPGLCFVVQGVKSVLLGERLYKMGASDMMAYSVDSPIAARVTQASPAEPYLSLTMDINPQRVAEWVLKVYPNGLPRGQEVSALCTGQAPAALIDTGIRLMELLAQPGEVTLLAPLVTDEILIRLLRSPIGLAVAQVGVAESSANKVGKAISWLRTHFASPMKVEELAEMVHMSPSSFHQHFKDVTSMSPLRFQKVLRLQEARRLMLSNMLDVNTASLRVGYLSVSQFSREYSRFFGNAPTKDINRLREPSMTANV